MLHMFVSGLAWYLPFWIVLCALFVVHFIADFPFQSDWMALNKSINWRALLTHTSIYGACFLLFGVQFALITFLAHTLVDALTSQLTSKLWFIQFIERPEGERDEQGFLRRYGAYPLYAYVEKAKRHWFFVAIGFDQMIHHLQLLATTYWIINHM